MMDKIKKLIELLDSIDFELYYKEVEEDYGDDDDDDDYDGNYLASYAGYIGEHPASDSIEELACELFINFGKPNYTNIKTFEKMCGKKYTVEPGESDSFGWLTGMIRNVAEDTMMCCFG